jgi:DNA-binding transcriptional LysR family regulator
MQRHFDPVSLRLFVAVCEERNIARAGERENIVASAISKRIAALEEDVAVTLVTRGRRGIVPTPAGEVLLRHARDVLGMMERMRAEISEFAGGAHGNVRVFASLSVLTEYLPDDIGSFLAQHRTLRVSLDERVSSEIARGIREGTADIGVCWDAADLAGLETLPYRADRLSVVVPAAHPLARRKALAYADTLGFEQIEIQPGSMVQLTLRRAAALAGQTVVHRIQVSTFDAACRNVAAGLGIAVVPREAADAQARSLGLSVVPLTDAWAKRRFVTVMRARASLTAAARLLVDHLHARAADAPAHRATRASLGRGPAA